MANLFFNSEKNFEEIAKLIFKALSIDVFLEGESSNVLEGYYYSYSVFGIDIRLEQNSYDYEDEFKYMILVRKRLVHPLIIDYPIEKMVESIVIKLLQKNFDGVLAVEISGSLVTLSEKNINDFCL